MMFYVIIVHYFWCPPLPFFDILVGPPKWLIYFWCPPLPQMSSGPPPGINNDCSINGINFADKPHAWHTACYIKAYLSVLEFNMQINWYLSASLYKSMYACLFSIHCFYVYCVYEKRSISEVVKDFNNNIDLVKWYINIIWLAASAILEN